ncbi:MAG TPA: hypothetical protein PLR76_04245 [Hyphomonas sp.]|nr:hypothetical protein [Hyphomonas sp.]MCB9972473.1 hypothetical protein [Hyphomonas sp.]MCC0017680.1 hypothetical protein [Rhodobiaceae bacterium]HPE47578.1 hypothetical protein [Hyphomonas sp.]
MNTETITAVRSESQTAATAERQPEVNEITRAIIAGEPVQMSVGRPNILARRKARWARRAAHG